MSDTLAPIADKLQRLVRLLSSDQDGEVIAAARALTRTLKGAKLDIHVLADSIGTGKKFSEADAIEIYQRGVEDGRREAESKSTAFHNVNAQPSWHDIAVACAADSDRLFNDRERQFVEDMIRLTVRGGEPSEKQASWLRKIYRRIQ